MENKSNVVEIQTIGNIYNNILKGLQEGKDLISLQGSMRSGKTYNVMIFLIQACLASKIIVTVARQSMPVLKRSVFRDFLEIMANMRIYKQAQMNKTTMVYTFENGSVMEFAAFDDEQKARGPSRDVLFCNEANELEWGVFQQLRGRTRRFTIIDYNPSFTEEHWIFHINSDRRTYHFISTFVDNPFLTDAIREEINSLKYSNPAWWQIFGLGQYAIVEGLVFPKTTWDECDITDFPLWNQDKRIGIDFGYSNDPTAAVLCVFDKKDGEKHLYMHELLYEKGLKSKQIASRLKQYNDVIKNCESADPRLIDELEDEGLSLLYPVKKYSGSVVAGVQKMLGYRIHITKTSVDLKKELNNYVWQKDRHGSYTNVPIDKFNHLIDAARYCVLSDRGNATRKVVYSKSELGFNF